MQPRYFLTALAGAASLTTAALADEFWIQPARYFVKAGDRVHVRTLVGKNFAGQRWTGKAERLQQLIHYAPNDTLDLTGIATRDADSLRAQVEFIQPGVHMVALTTNNAFLELEGSAFNTYLKQEGLDKILMKRQQRGEINKPGREAYRRCAKTLVQVGPSSLDTAKAYTHEAGMPLELVPEQNPYTLKVGGALTVRLQAGGQPLPFALVRVFQHKAGQPVQINQLRTNQNGRVLFRLSSPGEYMVSAVQMAPAANLPQADWQSTWATLTFGFGSSTAR